MNQERNLDISWGTLVKIALIAAIAYILFLIQDILIWVIFALILSVLFNPAIHFLQSKRIPRTLSAIIVYIGIFGLLSLLVYLIVPLFIYEIQQFSQVLPQYFDKLAPSLRGLGVQALENVNNFTGALEKTLSQMSSGIFNGLFAFFGGVFAALFVLSAAIFLSLEEKAVEKTLTLIFPKKYESFVLALWQRCEKRVAGWFLTRILGCIFVGVLSYIALLVFGIKYPFILALLAGILNFIPVIGPLITGTLIFLLVALDSVTRSVFVLISFIIIQQIENNVFTPLITKKFVGLPPVLVLIALVIGGKLWGIMGAILVIPLAGIIFEFIGDFLKRKRDERPVVL